MLPSKNHDVIIVLGLSYNKNNQPNVLLRFRLDKAIEPFNKKYANKILLTGAAVKDEITEAEIMRNYCLKNGIPKAAILMEPHARYTEENASLSAKLMKIHQLQSAIVVTSKHHIERSAFYFAKYMENFEMIPARNNFLTYLISLPVAIHEKIKVRRLQ